MRFQQNLTFDFPPDVMQKYLTDEKALEYLKNNHPDIRDIQVLEDREEGDRRVVQMKYVTDVSLPGPIKKVVGGAASQSMVMRFIVNKKDNSGTMEMIPSQMADKIKISGKVTQEKRGDHWVQFMSGEATVKVFGVGKMIEKLLVEKIQSSSETETRLRNEYIRKAEG